MARLDILYDLPPNEMLHVVRLASSRSFSPRFHSLGILTSTREEPSVSRMCSSTGSVRARMARTSLRGTTFPARWMSSKEKNSDIRYDLASLRVNYFPINH